MITIDWNTLVITVPQSYLTLVSGTLYELDTDRFRLDLKDIEDNVEGMPFLDTHRHNTEVSVAGTTYARTLEIINGYSVEFENGAYSVRLAGSNNNIFDVESGILVQNNVQVISQNAAGLVVTQSIDSDKLDELYRLHGLDASSPVTATPTSVTTTDIDLEITGDGTTTSTVTRT